jgi:arsenate reductase (thioredoxin)
MIKIAARQIPLIAFILCFLSMSGQAQDLAKDTEQKPVIIFVCEHGAAKSIVAAAYFNKLAEERGLNLRAIARGTNPDPEISPKVRDGLRKDGLASTESAPKNISHADFSGARRIVTFCSLPEDYADKLQVEHWDDLPWNSEEYGKSRDGIIERLNRLLEELNPKK